MKILIIRFSSFGDVLQTLSVVSRLAADYPQAEIHWVTRAEFVPLIAGHPRLNKVWSLPKGAGFGTVLHLALDLRRAKFTHVYDAHNNLRSHILSAIMNFSFRYLSGQQKFLRRSIYRFKRFLLFKFHKNLFPKPFSGQFALLEPLRKWGSDSVAPPPPALFLSPAMVAQVRAQIPFTKYVALAPSAAFELKRWPLAHWKRLIELLPDTKFVVLGGPEDGFLEELASERVLNLAGKLSLLESAGVVAASEALVANDTGLMHVAEQTGLRCLALMGPAPFGFPSRPLTEIFELDLKCRPCSKHGQGPCVNPEFHKCMREISPEAVAARLRRYVDAKEAAPISRL